MTNASLDPRVRNKDKDDLIFYASLDPRVQNKDKGDGIFGEEEHHVVARKALPILIERAKAGVPIKYGILADKLGIPADGDPMSKMLYFVGKC